jgi:hypothetical protein
MRHYHITRVLYIAMIAILFSTGLVIFAYGQTLPVRADDSVTPFVPYAGIDLGLEPPALSIPGVSQLACPYYFLMQNEDISVENPYPDFGLFVVPGSEADSYEYQTLDIPSTNHIGGYLPVPDPACGLTPTGSPVFPIFLDTETTGAYFLDGGSFGPDIPGTDD